jgi:TPR repeat protein
MNAFPRSDWPPRACALCQQRRTANPTFRVFFRLDFWGGWSAPCPAVEAEILQRPADRLTLNVAVAQKRWHTTTRAAAVSYQVPTSFTTYAAMDTEAMRRACVEFRDTLRRDTGTNLTAADCETLLSSTFTRSDNGEAVTLQTDPGRFYMSLGVPVADQTLPVDHADHSKVAWHCFREGAVVHKHEGCMNQLALCYFNGQGVRHDAAQAVAWFQKAADLGDLASKFALGSFYEKGNARAGVTKDAGRGFSLLCDTVEQGFSTALYSVAECYLWGLGVAKDAAHGVKPMREVTTQGNAVMAVMAQCYLTTCYWEGNGVEADTVHAALWCQTAADGGDARAIEMLPIIRTCSFCGTTPVRKHCERYRKVRYCNAVCQAAHWNRVTDPHKGHCRRAAVRRWAARQRQRSRYCIRLAVPDSMI